MMRISEIQCAIVVGLMLAGCAATATRAPNRAAATGRESETTVEELYRRGVALAAGGQLLRAEQYLSLAWSRGSQQRRTLTALLRVCLASSRLRTALNYAESHLIKEPEDWSLRYLVASIYLAIGDRVRARAELEQIATSDDVAAGAGRDLAAIAMDDLADPALARGDFEAYRLADTGGER